MSWFRVIKAVLDLAVALVRFVERRQLMDAGARKAIQELAEQSNAKINAALSARDDAVADYDAGGVRDDPFDRDNRGGD